MNKLMRILIFFDLPVVKKAQRTAATRFRNFLINDGYHMIQFSVYGRVCNGTDSVEVHRKRLMKALPSRGAVRMMIVTEKQYGAIDILLGPAEDFDREQIGEQLMIF